MAAIDPAFWRGKRVFLTGHTGFKGSWLSAWLLRLGAKVSGYALEPPTNPSLFENLGLADRMEHAIGDVRDASGLAEAMRAFDAEVVLHLAAQSLVRTSYEEPLETYDTNVMGTANLLMGLRGCPSTRAVVIVTTDKVYENHEWTWGYRENDGLGGYDPYSSSKACAEIVTASLRRSFYNPAKHDEHGITIATARAGNVLGGGDWAVDRIIPDAIRAFSVGKPVGVRNPGSTRPWQHVLEPLSGYLLLAERCFDDVSYGQAFNFGPADRDVTPVREIIERMVQCWDGAAWEDLSKGDTGPHEAGLLKLDVSKAASVLGWKPRTSLDDCAKMTVDWYRFHQKGPSSQELYDYTLSQIAAFSDCKMS